MNRSKTKAFTTIRSTGEGVSINLAGLRAPGHMDPGIDPRRHVCRTPLLRSRAMDAAVWSAIGLLAATSLGTLFYLGSRIDSLAARMDAGFARVDSRFDAMETRFDSLATRLDAHLDRHAS